MKKRLIFLVVTIVAITECSDGLPVTVSEPITVSEPNNRLKHMKDQASQTDCNGYVMEILVNHLLRAEEENRVLKREHERFKRSVARMCVPIFSQMNQALSRLSELLYENRKGIIRLSGAESATSPNYDQQQHDVTQDCPGTCGRKIQKIVLCNKLLAARVQACIANNQKTQAQQLQLGIIKVFKLPCCATVICYQDMLSIIRKQDKEFLECPHCRACVTRFATVNPMTLLLQRDDMFRPIEHKAVYLNPAEGTVLSAVSCTLDPATAQYEYSYNTARLEYLSDSTTLNLHKDAIREQFAAIQYLLDQSTQKN